MDNLKADLDMRDKKIASLGKWNTDLKAEAENAEAQYKDLEKSNAVIQMQMQEANRDSKSLDDVNQAYERARMKLKDGEALRMEFSKDLNEKDVKIRKLEQDVRTLRHKVEHPDAVIIQNKSVADVTSQMGFDTITRMHGTREDKISSSLSTTADLALKSWKRSENRNDLSRPLLLLLASLELRCTHFRQLCHSSVWVSEEAETQ